MQDPILSTSDPRIQDLRAITWEGERIFLGVVDWTPAQGETPPLVSSRGEMIDGGEPARGAELEYALFDSEGTRLLDLEDEIQEAIGDDEAEALFTRLYSESLREDLDQMKLPLEDAY